MNTERIFREAAPAQKAQKKLEKEFATRDAELQKMAKQARDLQAYLERENVTISDAERRNKERDLANLNRDFQRAQREGEGGREARSDQRQRHREDPQEVYRQCKSVPTASSTRSPKARSSI